MFIPIIGQPGKLTTVARQLAAYLEQNGLSAQEAVTVLGNLMVNAAIASGADREKVLSFVAQAWDSQDSQPRIVS